VASPKVDFQLCRCLTRQSKRSCSEAMDENGYRDKPSTGLLTGVPQSNDESSLNEVNGVFSKKGLDPSLRTRKKTIKGITLIELMTETR